MNVRLVIGIILTGIALTLYGVGKPKLSKESDYLTEALQGSENKYIVEGVVAEDNPTVVDFLVLASKEEFTGAGKHNGFKSVETKLQPIKVKTPKGIETLIFEDVPWRGEEVAHILLDEKTQSNAPIQWLGLKKGVNIIALGEKSNSEVHVKYAYVGTLPDYLTLLEEGGTWLTYICLGLAVIGIPLLIWGSVKK
ncbi:hypothetical protein [Flammeovirga sp. SubArs3]|uniref:hypothetical protein n=1 Tax=Flammeovirga sp. SubArs3 TaxID=2995316 RepID=UPI00248C2C70|nr:hypothetical protein [Flammeovirga sp. SubArs3]